MWQRTRVPKQPRYHRAVGEPVRFSASFCLGGDINCMMLTNSGCAYFFMTDLTVLELECLVARSRQRFSRILQDYYEEARDSRSNNREAR